MSFTGPPTPSPGRRAVPLALFAVIVLVVAGAAVAATAAYFELRPSPTPAGALTLTDDLGRVVAVPQDPTRVVVLAPSITDTMVALGLRDQIVGVDCGIASSGGITEDYNSSQIADWGLSSSMCIETSPSVDVPAVLNASPQLVLASTITSVADVEEMSTTYGLPVFMLQPSTLGGIEVDVQLLGEIFGVQTAANLLVAQLQQVLAAAQDVVGNLTDSGTSLPTVLLTYYASPSSDPSPGYYTFGPGTFGESLVEFVGAASVSANSTLPYPELSGPQVLYANPSVVIYGTGFGLTLNNTYALGPDWSSFPAVSSGQAYGIDSNLITEPDPTMVLQGLPILLDILHPGLYTAA
jgi:iron complex transport system substrate-binding protein